MALRSRWRIGEKRFFARRWALGKFVTKARPALICRQMAGPAKPLPALTSAVAGIGPIGIAAISLEIALWAVAAWKHPLHVVALQRTFLEMLGPDRTHVITTSLGFLKDYLSVGVGLKIQGDAQIDRSDQKGRAESQAFFVAGILPIQ